MKKVLTMVSLIVAFLILISTNVSAMTETELEKYLTSTYTVAGKEASLTEADKAKVRNYLAKNTVTEEQADAIKAKFDQAVALMNKEGVTEIKKLSTAKKKEIFDIAKDAASAIGLTLTLNTSDNTVEIYRNGVQIDAVTTEPGKLVQTGSSNMVYLISVGVAIIAVAAITTVKKVKVSE